VSAQRRENRTKVVSASGCLVRDHVTRGNYGTSSNAATDHGKSFRNNDFVAVHAVTSESVSRPKMPPNSQKTGNIRGLSGFPAARSAIIAPFFSSLARKFPQKRTGNFADQTGKAHRLSGNPY
jgi:hypothetical protein